MKTYKYKNGKFKSKRTVELENKIRIGIVSVPITVAIIVGFSLQPYTITMHNNHVNAQEVVVPQQEEVTSEDEEPARYALYDDVILGLSRGLGKEPQEETKKRVLFLFEKAEEYGINPLPVIHTIWCESMWHNIQSGVVKNGVQEPSYGLAQIHIPSHKNVTMEQALDPYFSIEWAMQHWEGTAWYGYDRATDSCNNSIQEYWK